MFERLFVLRRRIGGGKRGRMLRILASAACLAGLWTAGCGAVDEQRPVRVAYVFDGDTVRLAGGEKVRLIGIDCPEAADSDKLLRDARRSGQDIAIIKARGRQASAFTRNLLEGRTVHLRFDVERRDKYGRLLAYLFLPASEAPAEADADLWVTEGAGGEKYYFVNAAIVAAGYASPYTFPPNVRHTELFQKLYERARRQGAGLWRETQ